MLKPVIPGKTKPLQHLHEIKNESKEVVLVMLYWFQLLLIELIQNFMMLKINVRIHEDLDDWFD